MTQLPLEWSMDGSGHAVHPSGAKPAGLSRLARGQTGRSRPGIRGGVDAPYCPRCREQRKRMDELKVAVIGCGGLGKREAQIAHEAPGVRLVAVSDANEQVAQAVAASLD